MTITFKASRLTSALDATLFFSLFVLIIFTKYCIIFQVTEETNNILQTLGYMCTCRGIINVKGKGELKTYFVHTEMTRSLSQGNVASWRIFVGVNDTVFSGKYHALFNSILALTMNVRVIFQYYGTVILVWLQNSPMIQQYASCYSYVPGQLSCVL